MSTALPKPKVLCVDDEPQVLEGLTLHLRRQYQVLTATSGELGLRTLDSNPDVAVVLSDMRMPGMNGATFLTRARQGRPDATRMLLTGQADLESAIAAINEGEIFRFLTKPCAPPTLLGAFAAASELNRLVLSERTLLQDTLAGAVRAMTEVLALVSPIGFGRAARIKRTVLELAAALKLDNRWELELAAVFSQLGCVSLPPETVERISTGQPLNDSEKAMVQRMPQVAVQLLSQIPRLERVVALVAGLGEPRRADADLPASLLRLALDYEELFAQGLEQAGVVEALRSRKGVYADAVVQALAEVYGVPQLPVREILLRNVRVGMVFAADVRSAGGTLLLARGHEVTPSLLQRLQNLAPEVLASKVCVLVPPEPLERPATG